MKRKPNVDQNVTEMLVSKTSKVAHSVKPTISSQASTGFCKAGYKLMVWYTVSPFMLLKALIEALITSKHSISKSK